MRTTSGTFSALSVKSAPADLRPLGEQLHRLHLCEVLERVGRSVNRKLERRYPVHVLTMHAERLATGRQDA